MAEFPTFKGSWPWTWPWIGSYCILPCITRRPSPTNQILLKSKNLFVDGRTYVRTDGQLRPILLGRLGRVDLTKCCLNGTKHYRPAVARCPLVNYVASAPPWSVTDDDRRQRAKQYWPPTLCVGGPVRSLQSQTQPRLGVTTWPTRPNV